MAILDSAVKYRKFNSTNGAQRHPRTTAGAPRIENYTAIGYRQGLPRTI